MKSMFNSLFNSVFLGARLRDIQGGNNRTLVEQTLKIV